MWKTEIIIQPTWEAGKELDVIRCMWIVQGRRWYIGSVPLLISSRVTIIWQADWSITVARVIIKFDQKFLIVHQHSGFPPKGGLYFLAALELHITTWFAWANGMYVEVKCHFWAETLQCQAQQPLCPPFFQGNQQHARRWRARQSSSLKSDDTKQSPRHSVMNMKYGLRNELHVLSY